MSARRRSAGGNAGLAIPRFLLLVPAAALLFAAAAQASDTVPARAYELTTETVMPHLEEALRYATTRETRCLSGREIYAAFPILSHDSLRGCRLDQERHDGDEVSYRLTCAGGNGTTGAAHWQLGGETLTGRLDVKLGGKNMTFSQRVTAKPLGPCAARAR